VLSYEAEPDLRKEPAARGEPFWPAQLAAGAALLFYLTLPHRLIMGPRWLAPGVEGILLLALVLTTPTRRYGQYPRLHTLVILLLGQVERHDTDLAHSARALLAPGKQSGR
jgi:hypothetical protein